MEQQATLSLALTDAPAVPDNRRLAIDLRRHDIETALRSADDGLELLLDLEAGEVNGGTTRHHTLAIGCTREDLERMLENAGDDVSVGFDADALARAIRDPDTEAHGLREKMAVLAVVLATTGAAAGSAQAMPTLGGQGGGSDGTALTSTRDMPADSMSASVASTEGAPATRATSAAQRSPQRARRPPLNRGRLRRRAVPGTAGGHAGSVRASPQCPAERPPCRAAGDDRVRPRPAVRFGEGIPGARVRPRSRRDADLGLELG